MLVEGSPASDGQVERVVSVRARGPVGSVGAVVLAGAAVAPALGGAGTGARFGRRLLAEGQIEARQVDPLGPPGEGVGSAVLLLVRLGLDLFPCLRGLGERVPRRCRFLLPGGHRRPERRLPGRRLPGHNRQRVRHDHESGPECSDRLLYLPSLQRENFGEKHETGDATSNKDGERSEKTTLCGFY